MSSTLLITKRFGTDFLPGWVGRVRSALGQFILTLTLVLTAEVSAETPANPPLGMKWVPAGIYRPLFRGPDDLKEVPVPAFWLDEAPVTNADFLEFVRTHPQWRRSQVKRLFADAGYLKNWGGDLDLGTAPPAAPVTFVSWFAAKAFAAAQNRRLPDTSEWERAAAAGFTHLEGTNDPVYLERLIRWYSSPTPAQVPTVKQSPANIFQVFDLHGLVWEWTRDFNTALVTGDARGDTGLERQLFCGAGSMGATDRSNWPAFMRFGFRNSLKAGYAVHNLGFRCAVDVPTPTPR